MLSGGQHKITSRIKPGEQVVSSAAILQARAVAKI